MKDYKTILTNKYFLMLWGSQIFSQLTIQALNFLLLTRVYKVTGSTFANSMVWVFYALPALFIGPFAASLVDMVDRRKILLLSNLAQAVVVLVLSVLVDANIYYTYAIVFFYSLLNQFYLPGEAASLPSLVKKKSYATANSLFFITQQTAIILGFSFAGVLERLIGFESSLYLISGFLFLAGVSVSFLPSNKSKIKLWGISFEKLITETSKKIIEGYRFITTGTVRDGEEINRRILYPFLIMLGLNVSLSLVLVSIPATAAEIVGIDIDLAGISMVAPTGVGAALGALLVPRLLKTYSKQHVVQFASILLTLGLFIFSFVLPSLQETMFYFYTLATSTVGFSFIAIYLPCITYLQEATPNRLRGRIFGNYWFIVTFVTIIPIIFSGVVTQILGVRSLYIILTFAAFGLYLFVKAKKQILFNHNKHV